MLYPDECMKVKHVCRPVDIHREIHELEWEVTFPVVSDTHPTV
jgi:hypothetical protein